jgi:hypothetical protein
MRQQLEFRATIQKSRTKLWGSHVRVPHAVVRALTSDGGRRVIRSLNGSAEHQCALIPHGEGDYVLVVNTRWLRTLGLGPGDSINVRLRKDQSRYGLPVPEEFAEALRQDREGNRLFHALSPGRRRTLLHLVGTVKRPDLRALRASVILQHLHETGGTINYRALHLLLRRSASRSRRSQYAP